LGQDETIYLEPLKTLLAKGKCPADIILEKWQGELHGNIQKLIDFTAYKLP
jgi:gamma-glutamylcysteine synthetase